MRPRILTYEEMQIQDSETDSRTMIENQACDWTRKAVEFGVRCDEAVQAEPVRPLSLCLTAVGLG